MNAVKKFVLLLPVLVLINKDHILKPINTVHITDTNIKAIRYVGNTIPQNGIDQLNILINEGLKPQDFVLEIGCGALVASIPIMTYLDTSHFLGIDPNKWLIDDSLSVNENQNIAAIKKPVFLYNYDFDATEANIKFDYIISHSIISHAPFWQLQIFLEKCSKVLKENGKVVFSLRLTQPNEYGNRGALTQSTTTKWQYPGNTYFHKKTIINEASKWFKKVEHKPEYTHLITATDPRAFHDWFVLTK